MKRLKYLWIFILAACMSCSDFLDVSDELAQEISMEDVFENPSFTRRFHRNIYSGIPDLKFMAFNTSYIGINGLGGAWSPCSDELKATRNVANSVMTAGYNAANAHLTRWMLYKLIRQCNLFLKNAKVIPGDVDEISEEELADLKATARFFRAYYHYLLVELYGPVPLMTEAADPEASRR